MSKHLISKALRNRSIKIFSSLFLAGLVLVTALGFPTEASAHCDSVQGPVVQAALRALDTGNIKLITPYVKTDAEAELAAAFKQAREVRKASPEAKKLADQYFAETAVRLHREGEGAAYTGLKDEQVPAAIVEADKAMQSGNLKSVYIYLDGAIKHGVEEKYQAVVEAREHAKKLGTVEAQREAVEAELTFEKYIYELYTIASAAAPAAEGSHTH